MRACVPHGQARALHRQCQATWKPFAQRPKPFHLRAQSAGARSVQTAAAVNGPLVKICGVTNPDDALLAVQSGANFIGMIMWPKAKRAVSDDTAKQIATIAREHGAQAVGVFVDEDANTITDRCLRAGIPIAQLHGDRARASMLQIDSSLKLVYVMNCHADGTPQTQTPDALVQQLTGQQQQQQQHGSARKPDWLLIDGLQGGSGQALDWKNLTIPQGQATHGWLLAGGLTPDNVATAAALARPSAVDVSSGVCGPDGLKKDAGKVKAFIDAAKSVTYSA